MTQVRKTRNSAQKTNAVRIRHSAEFKSEALLLADKIGVHAAAKQLGVHSSQFYNWRSKAELLKSRGQIDEALRAENARLKRLLAEKDQELAFLGKAAAYLAKSQK